MHLDNGQDIINSTLNNEAVKRSIETDDDFSQSKFLINSPSKNDVKLFSEQKTHILDNKLGLELFMAPSPKSTTQIKLTFLDQYSVHPTSDKNELPFQASRIYYRQTATGDKFLRKWLSYCLNTNKFYCNICMAFSPDRDSVWVSGSSYTVKRIYDKIREHEEHCLSHEFAVQTFTQIKLKDRGDIVDIFDSSRRKIVANNQEVLGRIIDIIRFLAKQNLAFRGKRNECLYDLDIANESNLNIKNRGNFMELVKLISKYDPVLRLHIENCTKKYLNNLNKSDGKKKGRGNMVTFLSKNMFNKIIDIMRKSIQDKICEEVKLANFFSLEVDSTQDVSVADQLCIC